MLDLAFKNIMRQRTRTLLTVLGILIGIGAIVALGSIAEGLSAAVQSGLELSAGKIMVMEKDSMFGVGGSLDEEDITTIESVGGIKDVVPVLIYFETSGFGMPSYQVIGIDTTKGEYFVGENTKYEEGREIYDGEREVASVGSTVASTFNLGIGDYFAVKDIDFEVVGILEPTGISDIDVGVVVPLEDLKLALKREDFQYIYVIPDDITKTETIAEEIEDADENLKATTSSQIAEQAASIVDQVRFFTMGIGAVAAFVGGLGVMNTMIMAVMERRREIGVMKAIGATNSMILQQILTESAMISLIGGVGGVLLGTLGAMALGSLAGGQITATVTPGLAATGIAFALFLGVVGGFYPARNAAKLDPVETLRYE